MFIRSFHVKLFSPADAPGGASGGAAPGGGAPGAGGSPAGGAAPGAAGGAAPAPAFAETLPEAIRGEAAFRDIKDLDGLATSYFHATKMIGARPEDLVRLPAPDDAEAWNGVYAKLGRPEKPDGYTIKPPEGQQFSDSDKAFQAAMLPAMHQAGLSQKQLDVVVGAWEAYAGKIAGDTTAAETAAVAAREQSLKQKWGTAFDQNLGDARAAAAHYGGAELQKKLETDPRYGNDTDLVEMLANMGKQLREDGLIGRGAGAPGALSPAEAQQQIAGLQTDPAFTKVYADKTAPGHAEAVTKMEALYAQAYPEAQAA